MRLCDQLGELHLVGALDGGELLLEVGVVGEGVERLQRLGIVEELVADRFADQAGQARIALHQPAARRDAVGLVVDAVRIELVQVGKDGVLHQLGMQRRDAVDRVRADEGEIAHAHAAVAALVDQRDRCGSRWSVKVFCLAGLEQDLGVDRVDDLHVARQQPLEQRHRPGFQRFGQQRVVGVGEGVAGDIPGGVEIDAVNVDQTGASVRRRRRPDGCR